ncbi:MAG: APC family permease [Proteobacteria bacterium]|nr:APC family permease [Pseudomonadota bacterium]
MNENTKLHQHIGPTQMAFYAAGSMLGAGIYGLIGTAAGVSGNAIWLSFLVALVAAALTGLSYASLGSRHPKAGGTAYIVERAFQSPRAGFVVGLMLLASALIGIPTLSLLFARTFTDMMAWPDSVIPAVALGLLLTLALIIFRGIRESVWLNTLCFVVEAGGLLLIIATGISFWGSVDYFEIPPATESTLGLDPLIIAVMGSTILTFFAFIGFEDTLNIAEECRDPQRTLPRGLVAAMVAVALIYVCVAITAVSVVPWEKLADSKSPLTDVIRITAPAIPPALFSTIALFSITNTILVNFVTASRLLYGMAHQKLLPQFLGEVHIGRRTPHIAVFTLLLLFIPAITLGNIAQLAAASVLLLLTVFTIMNIALVVLQKRKDEPHGKFEIHPAIPILGGVVCIVLIIARVVTGEWTAPALAIVFAAFIAIISIIKKGG